MAARTRSFVSSFSYAVSGCSGSEGISDCRQRRLVQVVVGGQGRRRLDGVDSDDGAAEPLLVGTDLGGQVGERRLAAVFAAELLARRLDLAALPADAARPGVLAEGVDHGAADSPFGECLELDAAVFVEAMGRIDEADDPVLDEIPDVDRVGHGCRHAAGKLLDERDAGNDSRIFFGAMGAHERDLRTGYEATSVPNGRARNVSHFQIWCAFGSKRQFLFELTVSVEAANDVISTSHAVPKTPMDWRFWHP